MNTKTLLLVAAIAVVGYAVLKRSGGSVAAPNNATVSNLKTPRETEQYNPAQPFVPSKNDAASSVESLVNIGLGALQRYEGLQAAPSQTKTFGTI